MGEDARCPAPLVVGGPASTLALADDLARLMDDMVDARRRLGRARRAGAGGARPILAALAGVPADRAPGLAGSSAEIGRIEPAARRDLLIEAEAARLTAHHDGPVIAAGSTGSMPATAKFLHAVAGLPQGAVVLPGLDTDLDEEAWQAIGGVRDAQGKFTAPPASNHPQFAMHALLERFGIKRGDVEILGTPAPHGREMLVSEAMRPSNATAQWQRAAGRARDRREDFGAAWTDLAVIEAANPEMEALAIAVAMREARHLEQDRRRW